jgi:hypothetical protein
MLTVAPFKSFSSATTSVKTETAHFGKKNWEYKMCRMHDHKKKSCYI